MAPDKKQMINKKHLLPSCNPSQVSRETRHRWNLTSQQALKNSFNVEKNKDLTTSLVDQKNSNSGFHNSSEKNCPNNDMPENSHSNTIHCQSSMSSSQLSFNFKELGYTDEDEQFISNKMNDSENIFHENFDSSSTDDTIYMSNSNCNTQSSNDLNNLSTTHTKKLNTDHVQVSAMMFLQAQLTISDVLLMITVFSVKKSLTRQDENDLIDLVKVLAGPEFVSWNASYHARAKTFNPPRSKINTHFYCEACNVIIKTHNNSQKIKEVS